jgi:hypothetical protein
MVRCDFAAIVCWDGKWRSRWGKEHHFAGAVRFLWQIVEVGVNLEQV